MLAFQALYGRIEAGAEVEFGRREDEDAVKRGVRGKGAEERTPATAEILEAHEADFAPAAESFGQEGRVDLEGAGTVEPGVAAIAVTRGGKSVEVGTIERGEFTIAPALEVVAVGAGRAGSQTVNSVPFPGADFTSIFPRCF